MMMELSIFKNALDVRKIRKSISNFGNLMKTMDVSWIICLNIFSHTWSRLMPTGADGRFWSVSVGLGRLRSA